MVCLPKDGEEKTKRNCLKTKIIAVRRYTNINVQFENGDVRSGINNTAIRDGFVKSELYEKDRWACRIGEKHPMIEASREIIRSHGRHYNSLMEQFRIVNKSIDIQLPGKSHSLRVGVIICSVTEKIRKKSYQIDKNNCLPCKEPVVHYIYWGFLFIIGLDKS